MTIKISGLSLLVFILGLVSLSSCQPQQTPDQIIEIFRHGARGPLHNNIDPSWLPSQIGVLTPVGMRQHYVLGKTLAEQYPGLLGASYNYTQVYLLTDSVPRCIQSALSHLYGVYIGTGPSLKANYPSDLAVPPYQDPYVQTLAESLSDSAAIPFNFVPNIINIVDNTNAYIFQSDNTSFCTNSDLWESQNLNDTAAQEALKIFNATINATNGYLNQSLQITGLSDLKDFGDVLLSNLYDNRTLPGGIVDPELISNITFAFSWIEFHLWSAQQYQRETHSFGLLNATLQQLVNFRQGENYNDVALFSGHDDNIVAVLSALGVANESCVLDNFYSYLENKTIANPLCTYPFFASNLIIEFYNSTDNPYVKFYYNNQIIPLCNGQDSCPYEEFVSIILNATGNITLETYFETCGTNSSQIAALGFNNLELISTISNHQASFFKSDSIKDIIIVGLVLVIAVLVMKALFDQRKYNNMVKRFMNEETYYNTIQVN